MYIFREVRIFAIVGSVYYINCALTDFSALLIFYHGIMRICIRGNAKYDPRIRIMKDEVMWKIVRGTIQGGTEVELVLMSHGKGMGRDHFFVFFLVL